MLARALYTLSVAAAVSAAATSTIVPPGKEGVWYNAPTPVDLGATPTTDAEGIAKAISNGAKTLNAKSAVVQAVTSTATPDGYDLIFGPINFANNAPGYMGVTFLDSYNVTACAAACNTRGADNVGGACQYFNIWQAVVNGSPTAYTCSMYFLPSDASTAVNGGSGNIQVTLSRGYRRKNLVIDGGFETFNACDVFCYAESYSKWIGTSPTGGTQDAVIFFYQPYAYTGNAVALLGSVNGFDQLPGTITPAAALKTTKNKRYSIGFFHASSFSSPDSEAAAFVDVLWNGVVVATIRPGFSTWKFYQFSVIGKGNDVLSLRGGAAPAWSFIDDISVFQL